MRTPSLPWHSLFTRPLGARLIAAAQLVGSSSLMVVDVVRSVASSPVEWRETVRQMRKIGVDSLPIVLFTAMFAGILMVVQSAGLSSKLDMRHLLGWGAGYAIFREVGPVLIGLMFSGRVGANITAELGTMTVTEQVDGLRALAIEPLRFLIVPRFLAIVIMLVALLVLGDVVALGGALVSAKLLVNLDPYAFMASFFKLIQLSDLFNGLLKVFLFGLLIATVSCTSGMAPKTGARSVGEAVNTTVVLCAVGILVLDYLVTMAFPG